MVKPKILFLVSEDWFFWSHRVPVARAALQAGFEVVVATHVQEHGERIREQGFRLIPMGLSRDNGSPLRDLARTLQIRHIYRSERPDLVHHVALKPILYGSIAALGLPLKVVNAFAGMGYLAISESRRTRMLRMGLWNAFRVFLNRPNSRVLVQNEQDRELIVTEMGASPDRVTLIRGSGVDMQQFVPTPEPEGTPVVMLPARMLADKGVPEFVEAARMLQLQGVGARFVLAGGLDHQNPSRIPRETLERWHSAGVVEWKGHCEDMISEYQSANLVCLPSIREGLPKSLVEAAASGRAIVTADVPGCRDVVKHGVNGLLVPPNDPSALAGAILELLTNPIRRQAMAQRGRELAVRFFAEEIIASQTLALYRELLNSNTAPYSSTASS
jgi:glycosyltransferase involved in cell wall biosynthesis